MCTPHRGEGPAQRAWLGHPLHPVLTDVVLGTWTSSFLLDLIPGAPDPQGLGPAGRHRQPAYRTRVRDGKVEVRLAHA